MVTIFKKFDDHAPYYISLEKAFERIKTGSSKEIINKLQSCEDGVEQSRLKKELPCICFSGKFSKRNDDSLIIHSGYCILDFDHVKNYTEKFEELKNDKYIYACFRSPRGNGIKALVKIPVCKDKNEHLEYYNAILKYFTDADPTSKNLSRICFESFDENLFIKESEIWDKKLIEKSETNEKIRVKTDYKKISVATQMIQNAFDGEKHNTLIKASRLLGGYISINKVDEQDAIRCLESEILKLNIDSFKDAQKTILDGIEHGKKSPISEAVKIEREFRWLKDKFGNYVFLADESQMDDYLYRVYHGTLELGLDVGIKEFKDFWKFKRNTFTMYIGIDGIGKSTVAWYFAMLSAYFHDWKWILYSSENNDSTVKKKILEFYWSEKLTNLNEQQLIEANEFYKKHFRIISSAKDVYTCDEVLDIASVLYETENGFDGFLIDPYNSLKLDLKGLTGHEYNYKCLSEFRLFSQKYCSVFLTAHTKSDSARNVDGEGNVKTPLKQFVEGGQPFCNRADDILVIHRKPKDKTNYMVNEIHVDKIKDTETGGKPTPFDEPIKLTMEMNKCGFYTSQGINPILESRKKSESTFQPNLDFEEPPF